MHRRELFKRATAAVAVNALPACGIAGVGAWMHTAVAAEAGAPVRSFEQDLAEFALSIHYDALSPEVVAATKRAVLDALGCALGAVGTEPGNIAEATIRKTFGDGNVATIVGYPRSATVEGALFANGVLVRALDLNDTYLGTEPLHPSELLPTALAVCEDVRRSGRDLIEALVAGYEASMRINDAISFIERGFHPLCAATYGVPLIAGKLWGLSKTAIANAVGLSGARGYTSFVVNSGAISMMKAMGLAATAADGVFATRLAAQGFTGPTGTLEWFATKTKPAKENFGVDLDPSRVRMPRVAFKRFPVQIELQAVAEAGVTLSAAVRGRAQQIERIEVGTYPGIIERVADPAKFHPQTKGTADHSLPVTLAMALLDGDVSVKQFDAGRWRAQDVFDLVAKTSVKASEALISKRPKGRGAAVEITFSDGHTARETVEVPEGDPERPLSRASLEQKFVNLARPVLGEAGAARVIALVDRLDRLDDVRELTQALKGSGVQTGV